MIHSMQATSLASLVEDMKLFDSENIENRLKAISTLPLIAQKIGAERTASEIPQLIEGLIEEDEEAIPRLIESINSTAQFFNKKQHLLLPVIFTLCYFDNVEIQQNAISVAKSLFLLISDEKFDDFIRPALLKMVDSPFVMPKISLCHLLPDLIINFESMIKLHTFEIFEAFCNHENCLLRKNSILILPEILNLLKRKNTENTHKIFDLFIKFWNDPELRNRYSAIEIANDVLIVLENAPWALEKMQNLVILAAKDEAWMIRYVLAENLSNILICYKEEVKKIEFLNIMLNLLKDNEIEVSCIVLIHVTEFCKNLNSEQIKNVIDEVYKVYLKQKNDFFKEQFAVKIPFLLELAGENLPKEIIHQIISNIKNESKDNQLKFILSLSKTKNLILSEEIKLNLKKMISKILSDENWRIRQKAISFLPDFTLFIGLKSCDLDFFLKTKNLLYDKNKTVREELGSAYKKLLNKFDFDWVDSVMVEPILEAARHKNYLIRFSAVVTLSNILSSLEINKAIKSAKTMIEELKDDKIANVRAALIFLLEESKCVFEKCDFDDNFIVYLNDLTKDLDFEVSSSATRVLECSE